MPRRYSRYFQKIRIGSIRFVGNAVDKATATAKGKVNTALGEGGYRRYEKQRYNNKNSARTHRLSFT